jgi:hypothetical protein
MTSAIQIGIAAFAAISLAACTSPPPSSGTALAGGIQNNCINPTEIEKQTIVSDELIRFEMRSGAIFVNHLSPACPGLRFEGGFSWEVRGTLVCGKQQTIKVLNAGNTCLLGDFTREPNKT